MSSITLRPIGMVHCTRALPTDDGWDAERSFVELDPGELGPDAVAGLDTFSHLEVVYLFHQVEPDAIERGARHPRGNSAWPRVGILAQRAKGRPNRLGVTVCRLERVEGLRLHVAGLDAIDGTPVLDVKPWVRELGPRGEVRQPEWIDALMDGYW